MIPRPLRRLVIAGIPFVFSVAVELLMKAGDRPRMWALRVDQTSLRRLVTAVTFALGVGHGELGMRLILGNSQCNLFNVLSCTMDTKYLSFISGTGNVALKEVWSSGIIGKLADPPGTS